MELKISNERAKYLNSSHRGFTNCDTTAFSDLLDDRATMLAEIERLETGLNSIINCQSDLTRSQVREACADILKGKTKHMKDQSPFVARALQAESAITSERKRTAKMEAILKEANNMLVESRSGFISGSRSDLDWQSSRDRFVEEIRAALSPADGGNGNG